MKATIKKTCAACKKEFNCLLTEHNRGAGKYCSKKCWYKRNNTQIKKDCEYCNTSFFTQPSQRKQRFCSPICYNVSKSATINCSRCGKQVQRKPSQIKRSKHSFCGMECRQKYKTENGTEKRFCLHCHSDFISIKSHPQKYCSKTCWLESAYHARDGILYLIKMTDNDGTEFIKIGITTMAIEERWKGFQYDLIESKALPIGIAWKIEQTILSNHSKDKYIPEILADGKGSSECYSAFKKETFDFYINEYITEKLSDKEINKFYKNFLR